MTHLLGCDWLLGRLCQLLLRLGVVSQIVLATNEDDGKTLAEVKNLRDPLQIRCQIDSTRTVKRDHTFS